MFAGKIDRVAATVTSKSYKSPTSSPISIPWKSRENPMNQSNLIVGFDGIWWDFMGY